MELPLNCKVNAIFVIESEKPMPYKLCNSSVNVI